MERQVVIQMTDDVLERMLRVPLWRAVARRAAINTLVVVVVTVLLCWRRGAGSAGMVLWPAAGALLMVVLARVDYWRLRRAAFAPYRKLPDRGLTYRFTDEALEIGSIDSYSICRWKDVRRLGRYPDGWCLYFGPSRFVVVPAEALDDELKAFMDAAVRR
jgi:hypothetical protein